MKHFTFITKVLFSSFVFLSCKGRYIWQPVSQDRTNENYEGQRQENRLWVFKTRSRLLSCAALCLIDVNCSTFEYHHQVCRGFGGNWRDNSEKIPTLNHGSFRRYQQKEQTAPSGYIFLGSSYVKLHTVKKTWDDARKVCQREGTTLIKLDSEKKAELYTKTFYSTFKSKRNKLWIGLSDRYGNDTWFWTDGSIPDRYSQWDYGEPDNKIRGKKEDCGLTRHRLGLGLRWSDYSCQQTFMFVCEWLTEKQ